MTDTTNNATLDPSMLPPQSGVTDLVAAAFTKAQAELEPAIKAKTGVFGKYADLATIIETHREIFAKHDLSVQQRALDCKGGVRIQTVVLHAGGQFMADGGLFLPAVKQDAQGYGSAMTYARRYALAAFLGIAQDDDDGVRASRSLEKTKAKQAVVKLASIDQRDELEIRIKSLNDESQRVLREKLRSEGIVWTQLSTSQYASIRKLVLAAESE